ncbi:winged helix-turn-helix transcriptional regulator [Hoyosella rhizosphaerae]|uniref:Transcriptional regulator n=1 Tax=Hoyosella rhizosphaerae TaxID=1755582 RepID=A0A916U2A2_9ACTN|nr:metalloregulator ArsR/SmtB family transcription factor [Hoyosella rhizosphaerae]MBN4926666.1 winged helix-turn-helix transcriptional regulator [Hoyosella rhizosphaerae]GGC57419.1 transcriptional regulator [Hoyosella rhizosphaerae]
MTVEPDVCELLCLDLPHAERIRNALPPLDARQPAAAAARALSDPTRLHIATALLEGEELCVCDISWIVNNATNLVSHHLRQLRAGGIVTSRRDGKLVIYQLTPTGRSLIASLIATTAPPS